MMARDDLNVEASQDDGCNGLYCRHCWRCFNSAVTTHHMQQASPDRAEPPCAHVPVLMCRLLTTRQAMLCPLRLLCRPRWPCWAWSTAATRLWETP